MRSWGVILLLVGIGSFVLPKMGYQFTLVSVFGEGNELLGGLVVAGVGAALIFFSLLGKKKEKAA